MITKVYKENGAEEYEVLAQHNQNLVIVDEHNSISVLRSEKSIYRADNGLCYYPTASAEEMQAKLYKIRDNVRMSIIRLPDTQETLDYLIKLQKELAK